MTDESTPATPPLPPPVSALLTRIGLDPSELSSAELARAEAALEDATALALAEAPESVADKWRADGPPAVVRTVILKSARREFENPRQLNQEQLGEHMVGISATSGVYLTPSELSLIQREARGSLQFVGSIRTPTAYGKGDTRWPEWHYETRWPR